MREDRNIHQGGREIHQQIKKYDGISAIPIAQQGEDYKDFERNADRPSKYLHYKSGGVHTPSDCMT
ncbi:MAG: hypothetical protein WDO73_29190 [Ignavibacteriota bacterium]